MTKPVTSQHNARGIVVVTGAGSGVGAAATTLLLELGYGVVGVDRTWATDSRAGALDRDASLTRVGGDVADPGTWVQVLDVCDRLGAAPSGLVINAAKLVVGTVLDLTPDDFTDILRVNVLGAVQALQAVLPRMIAAGSGAVVAVSSTDALLAEQGLAGYCTSKGALIQLIRCVAVDHARQGIRANTVCPGAIDTPFFRQHVDAAPNPAAFLAGKVARHPSGRILDPEDVASTIAFLLDDRASRGVNGAHLLVDGGLTATFDFSP